MYVCLCHAVTDHDIRRAVVQGGARTMRDLRHQLGLCACCGRCGPEAREVLNRARATLKATPVHIELPPLADEAVARQSA
ncbi:bacterioferritin-associated ferredoxin [Aquisalimonas lutea]|uniref:bacterioferritin-associated ferredoxin n=1 Tax=Aquisalimonas lutea TaxID=1327750 RepID=UPI0025B57962|nr:bacterioferritin-associated ferredoxin [Aquisalimonas lutea]MDN3517011.1 bacterioferritin-associated ferredoxin [Aquisalimonas lutea]